MSILQTGYHLEDYHVERYLLNILQIGKRQKMTLVRLGKRASGKKCNWLFIALPVM